MTKMLCTHCGVVCFPQKYTPGSAVTELVLWILGILPGLIYCIWRLASQYEGCPACKAKNLIPVTSPMAQQFLSQLKASPSVAPSVPGTSVPSFAAAQKQCPYCKKEVAVPTSTCTCGYTWPNNECR